jgi:hypothetical protein
MLRRFVPLALVGIAGLVAAGCSGSSHHTTIINQPITMTISPNTGIPADGITSATITLVAHDSSGNPVPGEVITLTASGSGNIITQPNPTDSNGTAQGFIASTVAETKTVTAVGPVTSGTTTATVTFVPPQTTSNASLTMVSGSAQSGPAGTQLALPLVVLVTGPNGQPIAGVPVTYTATTGGGTLSQTNVTTDANGHASSVLTLGPNPGNNSVTVVALNEQGQQLQGSPVVFNETAQ